MTNLVDSVVSGQMLAGDGSLARASLAAKDGRVVAIGDRASLPSAEQEFDFGDLLVLPGVVDTHFHSLGDSNEGFYNATRAAAAGGITTVNDHPLDLGGAPTSSEDITNKIERIKNEGFIDFSLFAGVVEGRLEDIIESSGCGITGYKMLMHSTADPSMYGMGALDDAQVWEALQLIAETNLPVAAHAESEVIIAAATARYREQKKNYPAAHHETRPPVTETMSAASLLEMALASGARVHIAHTSLPRTFDLITRWRQDGAKVTGETCVHYLTLTEERWREVGLDFKINPPLRSAEDRAGLWRKIQQGEVLLVGSDHAPRNQVGFPVIFDNPSGSPAIETMLPLLYSEGVAKGRIEISDVVRLLCLNPARFLGLYPRKGTLQIGSDADIVVFDPKDTWTVEGSKLHMQSGWSVFEGIEVTGRPVATFVRGTQVFRDGEVIGQPGYGEFVRRTS